MQKLRNQQGFTLIELLVVIAIIGILAAIVLIGLNPAARINESNQAKAQADVRQAGSIAEACLTKELGQNNAAAYPSCATTGYLTGSGSYSRNFPAGVTISNGANIICVWEAVGTTSYWYSTNLGTTSSTKPTGC